MVVSVLHSAFLRVGELLLPEEQDFFLSLGLIGLEIRTPKI